MTLNATVSARLLAAGLDPDDTERVVRGALEEDLRYGPDVTSAATAAPGARAVAGVVAREPGVLAGLPVVLAVLDAGGIQPEAVLGSLGVPGTEPMRADGDRIDAGTEVLRIRAPLRELLGAERTLLNFLTHLSGIATATRAWADVLSGTGCAVRDTRKTTPGLRQLEKYAVRCGGGLNHRMGLGDAALIKDNHVAAAGGIAAAIAAVRAAAPGLPLEVECDTLAQVREALDAGARLILLDNMDLADLRSAAAMARRYPLARLEASGGLRLEAARAVAQTGVDFVAVGALTHSSPALDLGLDLLEDGRGPGPEPSGPRGRARCRVSGRARLAHKRRARPDPFSESETGGGWNVPPAASPVTRSARSPAATPPTPAGRAIGPHSRPAARVCFLQN